MRGITVLLGLSLAILAGPPARADEAAALTLTPADQPLELTSLGTVTGSIAHAPLHLAGDVATGGISLAGLDAATGGINVVQLATGAGNLQQSSIALSIALRPAL